MNTKEVSVAITVGNNASFALSRVEDHLLIKQEPEWGMELTIDLGKCTKARINELKGYLDRLAIFVE